MTDPIKSGAGVAVLPPGAAQAAAPAGAPATAATAQADGDTDLPQLAASLNQQAQDLHTNLHFQVDKTTGELVISVVDTQNNQVLMQIPNAQALAVAQSLQRLKLQLMDRTA